MERSVSQLREDITYWSNRLKEDEQMLRQRTNELSAAIREEEAERRSRTQPK